ATNLISQGADVLFQVAGGCGLGTLKAADEAGKWGIGVDKDQYNDAKRVLTSAFKRVDAGVFAIATQEKAGKFQGGKDVNFNLKNGGIGLGKISPAVPKASIARANQYKALIIAGKLKVPTSLEEDAMMDDPRGAGHVSGPRRLPLSSAGLGSHASERRSHPRASRHRQGVSRGRRERPRRLRTREGRGARAARRERRGQVDADE